MLLTAEGIGLLGLAVILAGPAPAALARASCRAAARARSWPRSCWSACRRPS